MKNFILDAEEKIKKAITTCGYEDATVTLNISSRPDLGQFQYNGAMNLSKKYKQSPIDIAKSIVNELEKDKTFTNLNIAGPGFLNITFDDEALIDFINKPETPEPSKNETIFLDYGGANVAKALHVGHLRSANIGEALKRLAKYLGYHVISDAHLGDWGRPMGLIILEIRNRYPELSYFKEPYVHNQEEKLPFTNTDLEEIYPFASELSKKDEVYLSKARDITTKLQQGHPGYTALWNEIITTSKAEIKKIYDKLNTNFDLYEGESHSEKYVPEMLDYLKEKGQLIESEGAIVIDVSEPHDAAPMPPMLIIKSDGGILYSTTELATLYARVKKYNPNEIWYVVDSRQELHFTQTFRAAYKSGIVSPEVKLQFIGFGTMNGPDGKPFKTRDGSVMKLVDLLDLVKKETRARLKDNLPEEEKDKIADDVSISAVKYADLLPNRTSDYSFEPTQFSALDGKTGPYLLYTTIRIKSLLEKAHQEHINFNKVKDIYNEDDKEIILTLLNKPLAVNNAMKAKSLNDITDYLYRLANSYNRFYSDHHVLTEQHEEKRESWLFLSNEVYKVNTELLDILGINIPDRM